MPHDADAEDARVLEEGDIAALLAKYGDAIVGRCIARLKGHPDAEDVAQNVRLRLLAEFHRGKRYGGTPYRVVVHRVIDWTIKDHFEQRPTESPLPEGWEIAAPGNPVREFEERYFLESVFADLPDRAREVATLRYLEGLGDDEIAARLGITANNVYQAGHRAREKLRTIVDGS